MCFLVDVKLFKKPETWRSKRAYEEVMSAWRIAALIASILATLLFAFVLSKADPIPIANWNDFGPGELRSERFEITRSTLVSIQGMGIKPDYENWDTEKDNALAYGWILNLETRQPVWSMTRELKPDRGWSKKGAGRVDAKINLPTGKYAAFYYCGLGKGKFFYFDNNEEDGGFFEGLRRFFGSKNEFYSEKDRRKLFFTVAAEKEAFRPLAQDPLENKAVLSITQPRNSSFKSLNFRVTEPVELTVYCLGEGVPSSDEIADGGYIQDLRTRRKIWELTMDNSDPAGGAEKNRRFFGKVQLPAGNYQLVYFTDDSHSYGRWNASPPYDPDFWGVTLLAEPSLKGQFTLTEPAKEPVIVQFLRVGDNELLSSGFMLEKPMDLRVYCIGEYSHGDDAFADYGYIENAATHRRAWEMTYANTEPAGGAEKNRMFDGVVHFPPGKYLVRYVTDDSHSFGHWNSAPPYDQDHWGIVVAGIPGSFDARAVRPYNQEVESKNVLVKMVGLHDDEDREQRFRLTKTTTLHIYAIGEGSRDEMYDYGWIENNDTGRNVWEMSWRNTIPAGGASKNRMFDDDVILPPGSYTVRFVTDGSHSTGNWNAAPPKDPFNWGITISLGQ